MRLASEFDILVTIDRLEYYPQSTVGKLTLQGQKKPIFTCEDTVRPFGIKVHAHTALPATLNGTAYELTKRYSNKFKRWCIAIQNKPNFVVQNQGVTFQFAMFHGGNDHSHTEGCPLVAYNNLKNGSIQGTAEKEVFDIIDKWLTEGKKVGLIINNHPQEK